MPTASSISIKETLSLLDTEYSGVRDGVAQGSYAFWLGSGISRDRVIDLKGVLVKLLEFLRVHISNDPNCKHRLALDKIIDMADLLVPERATIDYGESVATWPCLGNLLKRLWKQYSAVLSVDIPDEKLDYLLWTGLDFANTFADQEPDVEHIAIGMLVLEGAVAHLASANWDGLLEAGMSALGHGKDSYRSTVTGTDLRNPGALADLYKFHGCALRAIENEAVYRPLLIARSAQITGWGQNEKFKIVRGKLATLAQTSRTLMVGMSAQDVNIQQLFGGMNPDQGWNWTDPATPLVFSEQALGADQKDLLNLVYGEDEYEAHREKICEDARLPAYAKPLLIALLLHVLAAKLEVLANDAHAPSLDVDARYQVTSGIKILRDRVADAGNADRLHLVRSIAWAVARVRHQIQDGNSGCGPQVYFPIDSHPVHLMKGKLALKSSGQREAAVALGLIGLDSEAAWTVSVDDPADPRSGALRLSSPGATARVFFAANDEKITGLMECGAFDEMDQDAVVICSARVTARQQRTPRGTWRDGNIGPRFIALGPMLNDAADLGDLRIRLREGIGL